MVALGQALFACALLVKAYYKGVTRDGIVIHKGRTAQMTKLIIESSNPKADIRYLARGRANGKYSWPLLGGLSALVIIFIIALNYNVCGSCVLIGIFSAAALWGITLGVLIIRAFHKEEKKLLEEINNVKE